MKNITVSVPNDVYREARIWAAENNTSVSAAVRYFLENVRRILRVHKPLEKARQAKRIDPPGGEFGCEDVERLINLADSLTSGQAAHSRTASVKL